jgi:hypothetical protein
MRGTSIPIVPAAKYRGGWSQLAPLFIDGGVPVDELFIPDDLDQLVGAYLRLDIARRERFLRSATAIYFSRELWESSLSNSFLACFQAIEILTDKSPHAACQTCGMDTSDGPTRRVQRIVNKFCSGIDIDERVLNSLYTPRSAIAHGEYMFQLDEAPWASGVSFAVASSTEHETIDAAIRAAKAVLRGWLLSHVE